MKELITFTDEHFKCLKCGRSHWRTNYQPGCGNPKIEKPLCKLCRAPTGDEHLHKTCQECGFVVGMKCKSEEEL